MSERNVQLAREGFEAASRGDFDAIGELLAEDVRWHGGDPDQDGGCANRQQALAFMRSRPARAGGPLPELVDVIDAGAKVVVVMQQPNGARTANLTTFRDGKVVEMVHYPDPAAAIAAAGR
jgi:ketosteroid isomerase-like protein